MNKTSLFSRNFSPSYRKEQGLNLIEIIVVIVILGILAAIIIPFSAEQKREALKATVKSDVRNTAASVMDALTDNPDAEGFALTDPSSGLPTEQSGNLANVYMVKSGNNIITVTDVDEAGDPTSGTGDGAWNSYQVTGTNPDVPGYYYTFYSTTGKYKGSDDTGTPVAAPANPAGSTGPAPVTSGIMMTTWDTSISGCSTLNLTIVSPNGATIDWGDGTTDGGIPATHGSNSHTYNDTPGLKTVTIKGKFTEYRGQSSTNPCLVRVDQWNNTNTVSIQYAFQNATNLMHFPEIPDTITNTANAFAYSGNFNANISGWNVSNVTNMNSMFNGAAAFNQDLSKWNVSKVTDMTNMFYYATKFNSNISSWNVSNVASMTWMFFGASAFNQPLNTWNTAKVTSMDSMFSNASSFNQNISSWNITSVTNMDSMFYGASAFNQPLNSWNTSNVIYMGSMFGAASSFNQPLNSWNTAKVIEMGAMFSYSSFKQDLSSWNVTAVGPRHPNFTYANSAMTNEFMPRWVG